MKTVILAFCLLLVLFSANSAQVKPSFKITGIKIMTYNQHTNVFSKEISEDKDNEFWNALGLSVFVVVEVTSKPNTYVSGRGVAFTAYEGKQMIIKHVGKIGYFTDDKYYIPLWLYGSFCQPVKIEAQITGQREVSRISKTLNFSCGE